MERGNLLSKIREQYGNVYEDSQNHHTQTLSNPIKSSRAKESYCQSLTQIINQLSLRTALETELFCNQLCLVAKNGTDKNPKLLQSRLKFLKEKAHYMVHSLNKVVILSTKDINQATFIFDNLHTINLIITKKRIPEFEQYKLFKTINKNNYSEFLKLAKSNKFGSKFSAEFIYNQNSHNISFTKDTVTVDITETISILTGITSLSYAKTASPAQFNNAVKSLVAKEHQQENIQPTELLEAILTQKPVLAHIAKKYIELNSKWNTWLDDTDDVIRKQEQFFDNLISKGILPQEITLKTIIPDKNALSNPQQTLELFYEKLTK